MIKGIYLARAGMYPRNTQLEVVANNIANINTTGYKRDSLFLKKLNELSAEQLQGVGDLSGLDLQQFTDFREGALHHTGNPFDVAIQGNGFFVVDTEMGPAYTRNGNFKISIDGVLVTSSGIPVVGERGYIQIPNIEKMEQAQLNINEVGMVTINNDSIGKLRVVSFDNLNRLKKEGEFFSANGALEREIDLDSRESIIRQGFLEESNVDPISEMVSLIELSRNFEAYQRMIQIQDSTLERTIDVGRI